MAKIQRVDQQRRWSMTCRCLVGWVLLASPSLRAQDPVTSPSRWHSASPQAKSNTPSPEIRLNYFEASWSSILKGLARSLDAQLVMPDVPPGRHSRRDGNKYSAAQAIEVLNVALQPKGFRILHKPPYLLVLQIQATRPRYPRPIVSPPRVAASQPAATPTPTQPTVNEVAARNLASLQRLPSVNPPVARRQYPVNLTSHQFPEDQVERIPDAAYTAPGDFDRTTMEFRLSIRNQSAAAVATRIHHACRPAVRTITHGSSGLPAFQVRFATPGPTKRDRLARESGQSPSPPAMKIVQFTVAVDDQHNQLVVESPPDQFSNVMQLLQRFENPSPQPGGNSRVVSGVANAKDAAETLREPLKRIAQAQRKAQPLAPDGNRQPEQLNRDVTGLIAGLKGDVSVEAIEDLGVLIISGDKADVDSVVRIVQEMKRLGAIATPEIHLRILRHVNSESLSELLTGVYEQVGTYGGPPQAEQAISVTPVVKPNAVLIVAPEADMLSILKLTDELDQPVAPSARFQVIRLKNAMASHVLTLLEKLYDKQSGLGVRIRTVADDRTNSIIVQGSPRDLVEVGSLIKKIDLDQSKSVSQMRLFPLKNAVAKELAEVINTAIQSVLTANVGGQAGATPGAAPRTTQPGDAAQRQVQIAKSVVLQFLTKDDDVEQAVRSGILEDIRVTHDPRTNKLVVTAPQQSMQLIAELIRQLDKPTSLVADIKVFTLANADASAMVRLLRDLYSTQIQAAENAALVAGAADASSNLIPLRLSIDGRTNSIIAKGAPETLRVVEAILLRLDQSDLLQRRTTVHKLHNSPAADVAAAINQFLSSQRDLAQAEPDLVSTVELLEREVIVVAEPVSNSLLISSTPRYFDEIQKLARDLDDAPPQVIIQALLVEVVLGKDDEFGVELGVQDSILFDRSAISNLVTLSETTSTAAGLTTTETLVSKDAIPGFAFNNQPLGNNPSIDQEHFAGQALSNFSVGRVNGDLGYGGLVLSAGSESLSVLVRALAARRKINVLSRPQIRALNNQQATIQVGQQVPIVDGVTVGTTGAANPMIRQDQAGIILSVTPRISPEGIIVMEVVAEKSAFDLNAGVPVFTDVSGNAVRSPIKDITTAKTTVSVPNAQTIVLGGMITTSDTTMERKVPWLGDVPLLGHIFRYDSSVSRRSELLIFLTPRIICCDLDSEMIKQVETGRLHLIQKNAEEVHGPLFGLGEEEMIFEDIIDEPVVIPGPNLEEIPVPNQPTPVQPTP